MSKTHHHIRFFKGQRLNVAVTEGKLYRMQPVKAAGGDGGGRLCRVEAFDNDRMPRKARVRFEDTGRVGMVAVSDLLEATEATTA